jgi:hypothetical protein
MPRGHSAERDWLQPSAPRGGIATTMVVTCHGAMPPSLAITTRAAKVARRLRSRTPARLSRYDTLLDRLAPDLQDVAAALGECIQAAHAVVRQRHLARHRHVAPADQPGVRDRMVRGAKGAGHDEGGACGWCRGPSSLHLPPAHAGTCLGEPPVVLGRRLSGALAYGAPGATEGETRKPPPATDARRPAGRRPLAGPCTSRASGASSACQWGSSSRGQK